MSQKIDGEPDTPRGVRPVRGGACGNLPWKQGKALDAYSTCAHKGARKPQRLQAGRSTLTILYHLANLGWKLKGDNSMPGKP